jgi:MoaA/NifB/PqqE/SkfB family radical SAM enzyme
MAWNGVTLFPTFVCNFTCPFCAFSADLNQKRDELTLEEIEKIASSLGRVLVLHIGGGEPFIRKDLPEILSIFRRLNGVRRVEIPTNGWSAERIGAPVRKILEKMPGARLNVRISLDGIGELHDRLRARPGSYKAAVETLEALRGISQEEPRLTTGVCQTITAHNQEAALSTYRTIRDELRPDSVVVNVCREGSQEDAAAIDVVPERYGQVIAEMNGDVARGKWWNYPRRKFVPSALLNGLHATIWELISTELSRGRPKLHCAAGAGRSLIIYSTGEVALCELGGIVGSLRAHGHSVPALLATPEARQALEAMRRCEKRHEVCWHSSAPDPRLNPVLSMRVLARAAKLALARLLPSASRAAS